MSAIVFTGGGTAGHYMPNLALIPEVKKYFDRVVYIGSKEGAEEKAVKSAGVPYRGITCAKLERKFTLKNAAIPFKLITGIAQAKKLLAEIRPDVVFSKGGYVALPVSIAAKRLGIPLIIHESDISMGLANRLASKNADLILTSFKSTAEKIKGAKAVGSPLRKELFAPRDKRAILNKYGLSGKKPLLLVFGGSQGSAKINETVEKCLYKLIKDFEVLHICGKGKKVTVKAQGYTAIEFASDMGEVYAATDFAVSRGGANSLFELTALKIPTLAIPLPKGNSRGDQIENAKFFADNELIDLLFEEDLTADSFLKAVMNLRLHCENLIKNCARAKREYGNENIISYIKSFKMEDNKP